MTPQVLMTVFLVLQILVLLAAPISAGILARKRPAAQIVGFVFLGLLLGVALDVGLFFVCLASVRV
jgi:hypothetical protein